MTQESNSGHRTASDFALDVNEIQKFLPHRPPFLLLDRVLEIQPSGEKDSVGTSVVAIKNFTFSEDFFRGHFPDFPVVPGVLLTEACAQASAFCMYPLVADDPESFPKKYRFILAAINSARFRRPVLPGDTVRFDARLEKSKATIRVFSCDASVDGKKVAEVEFIANMTPTGREVK